MPKLAERSECTGCSACVDACRKGALKMTEWCRMPMPELDIQKCVDCGMCSKVCPVMSPVLMNDARKENAYGGWVKDEDLKLKAASGGAFAGLALDFFDQHEDGIVVGARLVDNHVEHQCIERREDIPLLMNSKYVQSNTVGIYRKVTEWLKAGRCVLFSGVPCQVAGLYCFLGGIEKLKEKLWTIDLICHGVASQEALDLHLKYYDAESIMSFRNKEMVKEMGTSQCTTLLIDGKKKVIDRKYDIFYNVFASWLTDRRSCHDCKFTRLGRVADITIGDFWGKKGAHDKGVSLILANNLHGHELVKETRNLCLFGATMREAVDSNANIWMGWKATKWHPMVVWAEWFRMKLPKELRLRILARMGVWRWLWAPWKVATHVGIYIAKRRMLKQYKDILKK